MGTLSLAPHHLTMLREGSGIADAVIAERGYRTIDGAEGYTELKRLGFSQTQSRNTPGLLLPLWTTDGQQPFAVYRPDAPRLDMQRHRPIKYELPNGTNVRLDCPPRCSPLLPNPAMPLWLTEGQKKADALASQGACAIALLGVWTFKGKNSFGGTTLLADFDYIAWQRREVRLVFDSDILTLPGVRHALDRLREHLERKGATVRAVYLPSEHGQKVGVDEYLVAGHTLADLEALMEAPRLLPHPAPDRVELLDESPACIRRPLALVDGRAYAALWSHVKVTRTETTDKQGHVIKLSEPHVTREQRLFLVRDDGRIFGDDTPLSALGFDISLPEIPPAEKRWSTRGAKAYRSGVRPEPTAVYEGIVAVIDRFIDFDCSLADQHTMCEFVACYVLATWFLPAFTVVGYLWPNGERGSGKTQLLLLVAELAYLGQVILAGGSYASLRDLADYGATLCFDDAEHVMDTRRYDPDKRALLLAGNRRGSTITVKEPVNGREWRTRHVDAFCPRLFSAIRLPDPVLASRAIIVPLIRTADRQRANADPLDYRLWPVPRVQLLADLWGLALCHVTQMAPYDAHVAEKATLTGRNLEPWRAILAGALWLEAHGVHDLWKRMDTLSQAYQQERPDFEAADLITLTIRALCHYAISAMSAMNTESPEQTEIVFATADLTAVVQALAKDQEIGIDPTDINAKRVGRVLGKMRLKEQPRPGGKGKRQWRLTKGELRRWLMSYSLPLPSELFGEPVPLQSLPQSPQTLMAPPSTHGTHGIHGTNGTSAAPSAVTPHGPCPACSRTDALRPLPGELLGCRFCQRDFVRQVAALSGSGLF